MRFNKTAAARHGQGNGLRPKALLAGIDRGVALLATGTVIAALAFALLTGEWLRWSDFRTGTISPSILRATHILAGTLLTAAILYRISRGLLGLLAWIITARGGFRQKPAFIFSGMPAGKAAWRVLLTALYWLSLGLLLLSGLERHAQIRWDVTLLPVLSPVSWTVLHGALTPYLYALLLVHLVNWGKMVLEKARAHIYTP